MQLVGADKPARCDDARLVTEKDRAAAAVAPRFEGASPPRLHVRVPPRGHAVRPRLASDLLRAEAVRCDAHRGGRARDAPRVVRAQVVGIVGASELLA